MPAIGMGVAMVSVFSRSSFNRARSLSSGIGSGIRQILVAALFFSAISGAAVQAAPAFNKSFNPSTIGPGSTSVLTFTITNDGTAVNSLSFVDNLPAGIVIANPASPSESCEASLSATVGGSTVSVSNGRLAANQSCTVSVNVTGSAPGVYNNVSGDLTSSDGNSGNATADLTITGDRPGFSKSFSPSSISLGDRSTLTFIIDNTANGSQAFSMNFSDSLPSGIVVADPANVMNTCTGGTVSANPGGSIVSLDQHEPIPHAMVL